MRTSQTKRRHSRGGIRPSFATHLALENQRGRRECRVLAATHGPPANRKAGGSYHRFSQIIRHSLRDSFNAVLRALPRDRAFLPLSRADRSARLTPASGCQDHTTSASAKKRVRLTRCRVHRIPASRVVTIAHTPLLPRRDAADHASDLGSASSLFPKISTCILRQIGTTGILSMGLMHKLPVVQSEFGVVITRESG